MSTFRPKFQQQGPANNCVIGGKQLGWVSCTAYAMAMLVDRSTLGSKRPTGCTIRRETGDVVMGTTLRQCADAARQFGVHVDIFSGSGVAKPSYAMAQLRKGHSMVLQGDAGVTVGTTWQSVNGEVNHAIFLNEGKGWDGDVPEEVLVYDPAADGRRSMDQGPSWWPYSLVVKFGAYLRPNGAGTPRIGPGRWYVGIGPDTEPHAILRFGAVKTKPLPDRTRADNPGKYVNVHSVPRTGANSIVERLADDDLFVAYQVTDRGDEYQGSTRWYGNQDGTRWIHSKRLSHQGGTT